MTKRENGGILPQDGAECVSPNGQVNPDAAKGIPSQTTESGGSGSTQGSPPVIPAINSPPEPRTTMEICGYDLDLVEPYAEQYILVEELQKREFDFINPDHPPAEDFNFEPERMLEVGREEKAPFARIRLCKGKAYDGKNVGIKFVRRKNENTLRIVADYLGVTIAGWND